MRPWAAITRAGSTSLAISSSAKGSAGVYSRNGGFWTIVGNLVAIRSGISIWFGESSTDSAIDRNLIVGRGGDAAIQIDGLGHRVSGNFVRWHRPNVAHYWLTATSAQNELVVAEVDTVQDDGTENIVTVEIRSRPLDGVLEIVRLEDGHGSGRIVGSPSSDCSQGTSGFRAIRLATALYSSAVSAYSRISKSSNIVCSSPSSRRYSRCQVMGARDVELRHRVGLVDDETPGLRAALRSSIRSRCR